MEKFMKYKLILLAASFLLSAHLNHSTAQEKLPFKISGYAIGDYFYKVQGDSSGSGGEYSPYRKDHQAFDLRRVMFIYEHFLSEKFTAGFTLEGGNKYLSSGRFSVIIKAAYIEWKDIFDGSNLYAGYFLTPAFVWGIAEKMWGYRSVEKTISDSRGLTTGADLGVGLRGSFDKGKNYGYFIMIANGTGTKPENNKYKNFYASFNAKPVENLNIETYSEFEPAAEDKNKLTLKGILAYQTPSFTIGTEVVNQVRKNAGINNNSINPFGISFYAHAPLINAKTTKVPKLKAFARFDYYDPDTKSDSTGYKENFFTVGLDYMPIESVHFMPNVWVNSYSAKNSSAIERKADVVGRITFYYNYR